MLHTLTDTQTDYLNNGTLYAPRHEEAKRQKTASVASLSRPCLIIMIKRLFCLKAKNGPGCFAPSALPHYTLSKMEGLRLLFFEFAAAALFFFLSFFFFHPIYYLRPSIFSPSQSQVRSGVT